MKRRQLNLVLAVAVAGLAAAVFFSQKKPPAKGAPLTTLKPDAIETVVIAHPGKPEIHLEKRAGHWMLTAPVQAAADPLNVNGVLSVADAEVKTSLDPAQVNKAELGLDPPAYTVKFNDLTVGIGGVEPLKYQRYVEAGDKIALIDDPPSSNLDADYSDLVSKSLLPAGADIRGIQLPDDGVARSADGKSWQRTPAATGVSDAELQAFVDDWRSARAMWNQLESDDQLKAAAALPAVTLTLADSSIVLHVVSRDPQFVLEAPALKIRYTLSKADADKLLTLPAGVSVPKATAPAAVPAAEAPMKPAAAAAAPAARVP